MTDVRITTVGELRDLLGDTPDDAELTFHMDFYEGSIQISMDPGVLKQLEFDVAGTEDDSRITRVSFMLGDWPKR